MNKKVNVGHVYAVGYEDGWYFKASFGPFETREEADEFGRLEFGWLAAYLEPKAETPPPLGVSVSETIAMKDKFG